MSTHCKSDMLHPKPVAQRQVYVDVLTGLGAIFMQSVGL